MSQVPNGKVRIQFSQSMEQEMCRGGRVSAWTVPRRIFVHVGRPLLWLPQRHIQVVHRQLEHRLQEVGRLHQRRVPSESRHIHHRPRLLKAYWTLQQQPVAVPGANGHH